MSVATNSILTTLTAGRMWSVGHDVHRASNLPGTRSYNTAVVMMCVYHSSIKTFEFVCRPPEALESGALYSLCFIAYVVSGAFLTPSAIVVNHILTGAMPQIVNIVPTLIAVRVGLSRGIEARWIDRASGSANLTFTSIRIL
ncbi:hypothetical protein B0H19DRAFT_1145905 [Mycena capillaripes]|nr:hypothetical protein B0H19DRAFT_1145905 [Mycena capillaripes]